MKIFSINVPVKPFNKALLGDFSFLSRLILHVTQANAKMYTLAGSKNEWIGNIQKIHNTLKKKN